LFPVTFALNVRRVRPHARRDNANASAEGSADASNARYWKRQRLPVLRRPIVLVRAQLPVAIAPCVVAELWGVAELLLGNAGTIAAERGIVLERRPRHGIVAV